MKKLAVCFFLLPLFFSCDSNNWDDTVIKNTSGFDVTFKFSNTDKIDLPDGEQKTFPTKAYQRLESYSPEKRVHFTYSSTDADYTGEFKTLKFWKVNVQNTIGEKVTLSAEGWMDDIVDIETDNKTTEIYTDKPNFIVTKTENDFPAAAVYTRDNAGNFNVTIQWSK